MAYLLGKLHKRAMVGLRLKCEGRGDHVGYTKKSQCNGLNELQVGYKCG